MSSDLVTFWQHVAKLYAPFMKSSSGLYDQICSGIRPYLRPDMEVLELACGSGQLSFPLAEQVRRWLATDFSPAMIAQAQKLPCPPPLHFSVADATALPYAPHSFDAVVISNALHIMPHPAQALAQVRRVLKPQGLLFAPTFLHGDSTGFHLRVRAMELIGFHTFYPWTEPEFLAFLGRNGFQVTEHRPLGGGLAPLCFAAAAPKEAEPTAPGGADAPG